jgi:hypothetical protein
MEFGQLDQFQVLQLIQMTKFGQYLSLFSAYFFLDGGGMLKQQPSLPLQPQGMLKQQPLLPLQHIIGLVKQQP